MPPAGDAPALSVLTVTRGRRALLGRKVDTLLAQTLAPGRFEWVVCVNGASDGSLAYLEGLVTPFRLTLVALAAPVGVGAARNACAARAAGETLYLSDDDCLLAPDTLRGHLGAQRQPVVAVGGVHFTTADGAEIERWLPRRVGYWNVNGANTSLPAAAFRAVGGFDERLCGYGGEDVLLGYRLWRSGVPLRALPEYPVRHLGPNPMRADDPAKAEAAGANAVRIARLEPRLAWRLGVHPLLLALKGAAAPLLAPWGAAGRGERAYIRGARRQWRR